MLDETLKFVGLVLGSSMLSTVLSQAWTTWSDRSKDKRSDEKEGRYAALRISIYLEAFAIRTINKLVDHQNEQFEAEQAHSGAVVAFRLPAFPSYPKDIKWKTLDPALAAYALSFPNEVEMSRSALQSSFDTDPRNHPSDCDTQVGLRGYRAIILASKLREKYQLPAFHPRAPDFDFVRAVRQRYEQAFGNLSYRHPYDDDFA